MSGIPIRVVVADDDALVRSGLSAILSTEDDIDVVGEAIDGADVLGVVARTRPDIVLMDVRMPRIDGIEATRRLAGRADGPAVVVITTFESDSAVGDALAAGARSVAWLACAGPPPRRPGRPGSPRANARCWP